MATEYPVKLSVTVRPVGTPGVRISAGGTVRTMQLLATTTIDFDFVCQDQFELCVEQFDKDELDPTTAVEITSIELFGIQHPKFVWAGTYWPEYPEHLKNQPRARPGQGYLSWNGVYKLTIQVPVFTWMHHIQDMGWIYD